jgi:hypothetical protein
MIATLGLFTTKVFLLYIVFSVVLALIVGFVWYSEKIFGPAWRAYTGVTSEQVNDKKGMAVSFVSMIVGLVFLSVPVYIIHLSVITPFSIYVSVLLWIAIGIGTSLGSHAFQHRPWKLYAIDQGYNLLSLGVCILMAQIFVVGSL